MGLTSMLRFPESLIHEPARLVRAPASSLLRYAFRLRRILGKRGDTIFIAAMPKSASSFLLNALSAVTGCPITGLLHAHLGWREQVLYYPRLVDAYGRCTVSRHHTRATGPNLALMKTFQIRPVIIVRNFFDVVPSVLDHFSHKGGFDTFPFLYCNERFPELDKRTQTDCVVDMAMPWFFSFYVSWFDACAKGEAEALWITFREMVSDWPATLRTVLKFYGLERSDSQIDEALEQTRGLGKDKNRLNEGRVGRGATMLSEDQRQRILNMARFYPWVDFSRVGIPRLPNV